MPDLLIRDMSEEELQRLDQRARALGLSRSEYVRRRLRQETAGVELTHEDLERFARTFADLGDPEVMRQAWQ